MNAHEIFLSPLSVAEKRECLRVIETGTDPYEAMQAEGYLRTLTRHEMARASRRAERFIWRPGDLKRVLPDGTRVPFGTPASSRRSRRQGEVDLSEALDTAVAVATDMTARTLEADAAAGGVTILGEVKHLKPAFRAGLRAAGVRDVQDSEKKAPLRSWEAPGVKGRLGGVDVVVGAVPNYRAFFELKWAAGKHELGWTLWDIYKLVAGRLEYGVSAYAIVGAPVSYWADETVDCSALYCDSTWESRQLFRRYEGAWADLLAGGTARPHRVPTAITTRLIAACTLDTVPGWELRALRVDVANSHWLEFDDGWPVGHHAKGLGDPAPDADTSPTPESYWVVEGKVLAGKYPGAKFDPTAETKIETLVEAGVRTFIDLTEDGELLPYAHLLPEAVAHLRIAVEDVTCPEREQVREALDLIDAGLENGVVYVHCRGGCGRTGVIIGAYLVRHGENPARALERVHELTRSLWDRPCPETSEQIAMVETWTETE